MESIMKKSLLSLAAGLLMLGASAVQAQGYVGLAGGQSRYDIDCTGLNTCDKTDTGYMLYGGLRLPSPFAVEAVYFDWGKATGSGSGVVLGLSGTGQGDVKATGFGLGVACFVPMSTSWSGVARLGVMQNRATTSVSGSNGVTSASASDTFTATFPYYGLGIGYNLTPNLAITGEADFSRVKYLDDSKANVQLLSLGIRYSF
jgi:OmpA-OmpF porin, OOP family